MSCFYCSQNNLKIHPFYLCQPCYHLYKDKVIFLEINENQLTGKFKGLLPTQIPVQIMKILGRIENIKFIVIPQLEFKELEKFPDIWTLH